MQAQLGGELAARAAKKITPEQLDGLEAIVKQQEAAIEANDEDGMVEYGHAFHRQINLAAASHRLSLLLRSVRNAVCGSTRRTRRPRERGPAGPGCSGRALCHRREGSADLAPRCLPRGLGVRLRLLGRGPAGQQHQGLVRG
ncbi:FCD domain-containing protein [Streptomyces sp. NPDC026659]|uniref:FCD domain-containing protein n=1 Tax=Streptomyces sp. NPDC026659 TaxID=3155123 RepID=UPI0033CCD8A6